MKRRFSVNHRVLASIAALTAAIAMVLLASVTIAGQAPAAKAPAAQAATAAKAPAAKPAAKYVAPRTPDGQPDLSGYYTAAVRPNTPFERPANMANKEFYTDAELKALVDQAEGRGPRGRTTQAGTTGDVHYNFEQYGLDASQNPVYANPRTSAVIDPPSGRLPARNPNATSTYRRPAGGAFDGPENRSLSERCIVFGNTVPIGTGGYNNALQIAQGPGYVMTLKK